MHSITEVQPLPDLQIHVIFKDGTEGDVDLSAFLAPPEFAALRLPRLFEAVYVERDSGAVALPNGIRLDPERLYQHVAHPPRT
jgi:hypothetical protein